MDTVLVLIAVVGGLYGIHRLFIWFESRGWMYYRHSPPLSTAIGNAMQELHNLTQPQARAAHESRQQKRAEADNHGEPKEPGTS